MIRITQYVPHEDTPRVDDIESQGLHATAYWDTQNTVYTAIKLDHPVAYEPSVWVVPYRGSLEIEAL